MSDMPAPASFDRLPRRLPIFPLNGALLLPGAQLPLNIFEPRYLAMTRDAMNAERMIGLIQPTEPENAPDRPAVYAVGCAGFIGKFSETNDGRYLIALNGICRFHIVEELSISTPYRQAIVSYGKFRADLEPPDTGAVDRERLMKALRLFLSARTLPDDWHEVEEAPLDMLVNSLAMLCPFAPNEKQALLEAQTLAERATTVTALIEMALASSDGQKPARPN